VNLETGIFVYRALNYFLTLEEAEAAE